MPAWGRSVKLKTVTSGFSESAARGRIFKTSVTVFHYKDLPAGK